MAYTRTDWVSGETPLSAENMNNIEDGIEECQSGISDLNSKLQNRHGYTVSNVTVGAGDRTLVTISKSDLGITGQYLNIIPISVNTGSGYHQATIYDVSNDNVTVLIHSLSTAPATVSVYFKYLVLS